MNNNLDYFFDEDSRTSKVFLNNIKFKKFLEFYMFFKNRPNTNSSFNLLRRNGIFLEIVDEVYIKDFVLEFIEKEFENDSMLPRVFNMISSKVGVFKRDFLSMLKSEEIKTLKDTEKKSYLLYENCIVCIEKNAINKIDYNDAGMYVWRDQVIGRKFIEFDHHESQYREFVWLISGGFDLPKNPSKEEVHKYDVAVAKYNTFKSVIGYLLHSYKTSSNNKAIIFNDEMISDEPNGRSGKGLFWNALKHLKKVQSINGKAFSFQKSFAYQSISTDCQILVFDDVKKNFPFENLFSVITEGVEIEYKNKDLIKLPVEESPKIIITTNYTITGDGGSHEARKFEVELSSFFNSSYTPEDHFGGRLFDDWDSEEWARFDNFMIQCIQFYLTNGLVKSNHNNLNFRKLIDNVSQELYSFSESLKINEWLNIKDLYDSFLVQYPEFKKFGYKQNKLTVNLKKIFDFNKIDYEFIRSNGVTKLMVKNANQNLNVDIWDELNQKSNFNA